MPPSQPVFRAVFFDAVGTLLFAEPPAAVVYARVGQRYGSRLGVEDIRVRFAQAWARQEARDRAAGWRTSEAREEERWRQIVAEVLPDVTAPAACFQELYHHFAQPQAWRCPPETAAVLAALRQRGLLLGLASNYDRRLRQVLAGRPELAPLERVLLSSELGWRKPAPEFFAALCRLAGLPPQHILFVGDDWDNDYQAARAAGLAARWYHPEAEPTAPTQERLTSLEALLRETDNAGSGAGE
jgi:putative hydrolase of the HAD superfamily